MKPSSRITQGPAECHGWTVFAIGDDGKRRCLYCLLELGIEVRAELDEQRTAAVLADQKRLRRRHRQGLPIDPETEPRRP